MHSYENLCKEAQEELEKEMRENITNPSVNIILDVRYRDRACILHGSMFILSASSTHKSQTRIVIEYSSWCGTFPQGGWKRINFQKLPRNIGLLLGITHRKFFEEYKKIIDERVK